MLSRFTPVLSSFLLPSFSSSRFFSIVTQAKNASSGPPKNDQVKAKFKSLYVPKHEHESAFSYKLLEVYKKCLGVIPRGRIQFEGYEDTIEHNTDGNVSISFLGKVFYVGKVDLNNEFHGKGKILLGKWTYEGTFNHGLKHGSGTSKHIDGRCFILEYDNGIEVGKFKDESLKLKKNCFGTLEWKNRTYEGYIKNGVMHGKGSLKILSGISNYRGFFANGLKCGRGVLYDLAQNREILVYEGSWRNNLFHGEGSHFSFESGYIGNFKFGLRHGFGTLETIGPSGGTYTGFFKFGVRHGNGLKLYSDGRIFEGKYQYSRRVIGKYTYTDGAVYIGSFSNELRNGNGKMRYPDGSGYKGQWLNDLYDGIGYEYLVGGAAYHGEFREGKRHGFGKFSSPSGEIYEGNWLNGLRSGLGKETYANKSSYTGYFLNDKRNGYGEMIMSDGQYYNGKWLDGEFAPNSV